MYDFLLILYRPHYCVYPFVVPIVSPFCHISDAAVLNALLLRRHIRCHTNPLSLPSSVYDSFVPVNLHLPCRSHPPLSPSSHISYSTILSVLHLCRVSGIAVSIIPCICRCCAPFMLSYQGCNDLFPPKNPNIISSCSNSDNTNAWGRVSPPITGITLDLYLNVSWNIPPNR